MDDAKEVHTAMRRAGGLFQYVQKHFLPLLREKAREGGDLDPRVVRAYMDQCTAEAQEGRSLSNFMFCCHVLSNNKIHLMFLYSLCGKGC